MKILAIGNSFSDDSMEYLYPVLQALGVEDVSLGNLYIGGCSLKQHVENMQNAAPAYEYRTNTENAWETTFAHSLNAAVCSQEWDVISMQQASHESGMKDSYQCLPKLVEFVYANAPKKVKLAWNMTWAYQEDSTHEGFKTYGCEQKTMYYAILEAVKRCVIPTEEFVFLFPVGTAIQNARTSYLGDTLTRDGFHLSIPFGRYIAALTWARVLTGKTVRNISYAPNGIGEKMKFLAIESVENAVKSPFEITQSVFVNLEE